ncbi:MAG: hypothetical protein ACYDER_24180 [Ktedonobacteraceae bacterium]
MGNAGQGHPALSFARGACSTSAAISAPQRRFPPQAIFPFAFRLPVGWVIQASPSECFLGVPGIQVKRDATYP